MTWAVKSLVVATCPTGSASSVMNPVLTIARPKLTGSAESVAVVAATAPRSPVLSSSTLTV